MEKTLICASLLFLFSLPIFGNGPPINGDTAFVTGLNGAAAQSFFKVTRKSRDGSGRLHKIVQPLIFPYEVLENQFVAGIKLPLILVDRQLADGQHRTSAFGLGDLVFFGKVNLFQNDWHQGTFRIAGSSGLELPTGDTNHGDNLGTLDRPFQRGKGSWNPFFGVATTYLERQWGLNGDISYQINTEGKNFEFGDELKYNVSFAYRIIPSIYRQYPDDQINGFLELNGSWVQKHEDGGAEIGNTGGNTLFFSPGLQYMYQTVIFEASFQYPIQESLNGIQLDTDFSFNFGFRWLIF